MVVRIIILVMFIILFSATALAYYQKIWSDILANSNATPALTKNMALFTIKKAYNVEPQSSGPYGPYLSIEGKRAVWSVYLPDNSIVTIDGNTGETIGFSHPKEGSKYNQVPTGFNLTKYYLEVYGPYLTVGLAIIGGVFLLKRKNLQFFKK